MPSFNDLGLRQELLRALEDDDLEQPTALQEAVIPALRRGSNLIARASAGSGRTLAYALGVLDRLQPRPEDADGEETSLRCLVVVPTTEAADRAALSIFPYVQAAGLSLTVPGGTWGLPVTAAEILVAPVADVMPAVRGSALKLDALEAVVIDGASSIYELGDWEQVDALLDLVPRDAQRVLFSAAFPQAVQDLAERRIKRALSYPAESVLPEERQVPFEGKIGYVLLGEREKLEVLARQLAQPKSGEIPPVIFCRNDERAADLAEQLSVRGFLVGAADDAEADVAVVASDATREELLEESGDELGQTISYDVPADAATLLARHRGDDDAVVLVEARELPHLKEIAAQAHLRAQAVPLPVDRSAATARLNAFRDELRRAIREEDLAAQLLVLEPLLEEFSGVELAAAAVAMLRHRRSDAAAVQAAAPVSAPARATETGPAPATWARLYVSIGSRDEIRPGDLVGALAGEANIPGSRIGKIEIRDTFSIVEVQADVADQVIRAVNGTTIKGRSVRVDFDRGAERARRGSTGPARRQARPDGTRRVMRRPPRDE